MDERGLVGEQRAAGGHCASEQRMDGWRLDMSVVPQHCAVFRTQQLLQNNCCEHVRLAGLVLCQHSSH